jgi:hypothetical protein
MAPDLKKVFTRIARKRGKFVSSDKKLADNSSVAVTASAKRQQGDETTELQL